MHQLRLEFTTVCQNFALCRAIRTSFHSQLAKMMTRCCEQLLTKSQIQSICKFVVFCTCQWHCSDINFWFPLRMVQNSPCQTRKKRVYGNFVKTSPLTGRNTHVAPGVQKATHLRVDQFTQLLLVFSCVDEIVFSFVAILDDRNELFFHLGHCFLGRTWELNATNKLQGKRTWNWLFGLQEQRECLSQSMEKSQLAQLHQTKHFTGPKQVEFPKPKLATEHQRGGNYS